MRVLTVGRARPGPERELFARYARRLRPELALTELAEGRGSAAEIKRREAQALLAALPSNATVIVLDQAGESLTSLAFASRLDRWLAEARPLCFVIGGAEGLDQAVIERATWCWSLGAPTWPHMLVRVLLAEQLYRARAITAGHPYHRSGRP